MARPTKQGGGKGQSNRVQFVIMPATQVHWLQLKGSGTPGEPSRYTTLLITQELAHAAMVQSVIEPLHEQVLQPSPAGMPLVPSG
jgi:hypothetical protein